jgi:hypothetical protein
MARSRFLNQKLGKRTDRKLRQLKNRLQAERRTRVPDAGKVAAKKKRSK